MKGVRRLIKVKGITRPVADVPDVYHSIVDTSVPFVLAGMGQKAV